MRSECEAVYRTRVAGPTRVVCPTAVADRMPAVCLTMVAGPTWVGYRTVAAGWMLAGCRIGAAGMLAECPTPVAADLKAAVPCSWLWCHRGC